MLFRGELLPKVFNIVMGQIIGLVPTDIWLKLVVFINGTFMAPIHNKRSPFNKVDYQSRGFVSIRTLFSNLCLSFVVVCVVVCIEEGRVMRAIVDTILQLFASREVLVPLFFGKKKENNKNTNIRPRQFGYFCSTPLPLLRLSLVVW